MGVHGLWKLVEPSGKIVPLDTLENKVLAVDVSIWLHQALKGFQDGRGNAVPNAHLLGLFHRICKLLFYKIKPVFVFDGGIPHLKKQTVAARRQQKSKAEQKSEQAREKLLKNIIKHRALRKVLGLGQHAGDVGVEDAKSQQAVDMFHLPPMQQQTHGEGSGDELLDEDEDDAFEEVSRGQHYKDLHSINVNSADFKALPANVRHDILSELKETRKQSSWGKLHEIPKESGDFSSYQMERLLKRRSVQVSLEDAEKEMGGRTLSLGELEELLCDQGVVLTSDLGKRIASDNVTRYLYVTESQGNESKRSRQVDSGSELSSSPEKPEASKTVVLFHGEAVESTGIKELNSRTSYDTENAILTSNKMSSDEDQDDLSVSTRDPLLHVARDFMLENSSLTQEQILGVIRNQNIPNESANVVHAISSPTSKLENVFDQKKVDLENRGVTQKEILAMIQDELARCKELLEQERCGEGTSTIGNDGTISVGETEAGKPDPPHFQAITDTYDTSTNVGVVQEQHTITADVSLSSCVPGEGSDSLNNNITCAGTADKDMIAIDDKTLTSGDESDGDFVEVTEQQVNHDTETQGEVLKPNCPSGSSLNSKIAVVDDIFADVFLSADTQKLDEIVGRLNKTRQVTSKLSDVESRVSNGVAEEIVRSSKILSQESVETDLQSNSIEEVPNSTGVSLEVGRVDKQIKARDSIDDSVKIVADSEIEIASNEVMPALRPAERVNLQDLHTLQVNLESEQMQLLAEKGKQERLAASITDQMHVEAQELLRLFGIPFIVAPMEAEAQCAFLDLMSLTDGTITDDSDIWLFGGERVYKNFFNHKKQVLQFQATDILHYFKLNRQQLILMALLVGSDYTIGLSGVGPVTALEILSVFPSHELDQGSQGLLQGLKMFRDWLRSGVGMGPSKAALRSKLKNVHIHEGFPSVPVVDAYLHPQVDESKEAFSWGTPDLLSLQNFARKKFSWTSKKTDEILLPVLKRLSESKNQKSIDTYFKVETVLQAADGTMSKRVQQAVQRIGGGSTSDYEEPRPKQARKASNQPTQRKKQNSQRAGGLQRINENTSQNNNSGERCDTEVLDLPGTSGSNASPAKEFIPQREQDKVNSLKNKMKAIEVFRKSKFGLDRTKRDKRVRRQILKEAYLSESSSDSN